MSPPGDPSRDLLFGLLALQNGLIDQGALFAAFDAWTRHKSRSLADHLVDLGHLDAPRRIAIEAIVALHVQALGGDPGKSLTVLAVGPSPSRDPRARRRPRGRGDPRTHRPGARPDPRRSSTPTYPAAIPWARPPPTVSGSASSGPTPGAAWAPSSSPSTPSSTARSPSSRSSTTTPTTRSVDPDSSSEARITGGLEHPGIVPVYGLGTHDDGRPYYAMRFIRGDSLKEAIDQFHARAAPGRIDGLARSWRSASCSAGSWTSATPSTTPTPAA